MRPAGPRSRGIDPLDVVGVELEAEQVKVLGDPPQCDRLREHGAAALDVPPQDDLGGRAAEALGDRGDHGVVEHPALRDRR